jgi:hypothetical protein
MAPIAHQPGPGGYQGTSTFQLVELVVLGCTHGSTGGATGAGFAIWTSLFRIAYRRPLVLASEAEAHAGIAFYALDSCYNKPQQAKSR